MRKIITTTFVTLDGVMQAPGGPEEDTSNDFRYGGWQFAWDENDEKADEIMRKMMTEAGRFDLLLGRITYDIWSEFWPKHKDEAQFGKPFDRATKYVVSHQQIDLTWENSVLITGDVVDEIKKLKNSEGHDLWVWGSGNLIQALLQHDLIDRMHIWTYPLTLGTGKKLFAEGTKAERFRVVDSHITSSGIVFATYESSKLLKPTL